MPIADDNTIPTTLCTRVWVSTPATGGRHLFPGSRISDTASGKGESSVSYWVPADQIDPKMAMIANSSRGNASFALRFPKGITYDFTAANIELEAKQYICICRAPEREDATPANNVVWLGTIQKVEKTVGTSGGDNPANPLGVVFATELGVMFDRMDLINFRSDTGRVLQSPPTFNYESGQSLCGNFTPDESLESEYGYDIGRFTSNLENIVTTELYNGTNTWPSENPDTEAETSGQVAEKAWTAKRVLLHIITYCQAQSAPTIKLASSSGEANVNHNACLVQLSDPKPQVWNFSHAKLGGVLDMLCEGKGITWKIEWVPGTDYLQIRFNSTVSADIKVGNDVIVPGNIGSSINLDELKAKAYNEVEEDSQDRVDAVIVEGANIVACGTIKAPGFNALTYTLVPDWGKGVYAEPVPAAGSTNDANSLKSDPLEKSAIEYLYVTGNGAEADAPENDAYRQLPYFHDVFSKFKLRLTNDEGQWDGIIKVTERNIYVDDDVEDLLAFCPKFTWDATAKANGFPTVNKDISSDANAHSTPSIGAINLTRRIPWNIGQSWDEDAEQIVDNRSKFQKTNPQQVQKLLFNFDGGTIWYNVTEPLIARGFERPDIRYAEGGAGGININFGINHMAAKEDWAEYKATKESGTDATLDGATAYDPTLEVNSYSWRYYAMTIGIECDQKVRAIRVHPDIADVDDDFDTIEHKLRNVLRVSVPSLECNFIHKGTLVGTGKVDADGTNTIREPVQVTKDIFVRNDFPLAERIAAEFSSWAFRPTKTINVELPMLSNYETQSWLRLGKMISTVFDNGRTYAVNTPINAIVFQWGENSESIHFATAKPGPTNVSGSSMIMSGTGSTSSAALGGSLIQAVKDAKKEIKQLKKEIKDVPVSYPTSTAAPGSGRSILFGEVYGGNATPLTKPTEDDFNTWTFPDAKNHVFSLASDEDPAEPTDWEDIVLPKTFEHGDDLPEAWPPGLGLVRLLKGSAAFGTSSWDADLETFGSDEDEPTIDDVWIVRAQVRNSSELYIYFSEAVTWTGTYDDVEPENLVNVSFSNVDKDGNILDPVTITSFNGVTDNIAKFSLSRAIEDNETGQLIDVVAGMVKDAQDNLNYDVPGSVPFSRDVGTIVFSEARNCYVYVVNRQSGRGLLQGDLVDLQDFGFTVSDLQDPAQTLTFLDCLPRNGGFKPHTHMNPGSGVYGGGQAMASFAPTTFQGLLAANMASVIRLEQND